MTATACMDCDMCLCFKQVKCLDQLSVVGAVQAAAKATPTSNNDWLYKIEKLPINI